MKDLILKKAQEDPEFRKRLIAAAGPTTIPKIMKPMTTYLIDLEKKYNKIDEEYRNSKNSSAAKKFINSLNTKLKSKGVSATIKIENPLYILLTINKVNKKNKEDIINFMKELGFERPYPRGNKVNYEWEIGN